MQLNLRRANLQKYNQANASGSKKKLTGRSACKRMLWPVRRVRLTYSRTLQCAQKTHDPRSITYSSKGAIDETNDGYCSQELEPEILVIACHVARFENYISPIQNTETIQNNTERVESH